MNKSKTILKNQEKKESRNRIIMRKLLLLLGLILLCGTVICKSENINIITTTMDIKQDYEVRAVISHHSKSMSIDDISEAMLKLEQFAHKLGCDAIVGLRIEGTLIYGTAVTYLTFN